LKYFIAGLESHKKENPSGSDTRWVYFSPKRNNGPKRYDSTYLEKFLFYLLFWKDSVKILLIFDPYHPIYPVEEHS